MRFSMHVGPHVHRNLEFMDGVAVGARRRARTSSGLSRFNHGLGQAQLAGDQVGEQGVAQGGEGLGLLLVPDPSIQQ